MEGTHHPQPKPGEGPKSSVSFWLWLLSAKSCSGWEALKCGFPLVQRKGESGANLQEYRGLSENASMPYPKQRVRGMESLITDNPVTHWWLRFPAAGGHWLFCARLVSISLSLSCSQRLANGLSRGYCFLTRALSPCMEDLLLSVVVMLFLLACQSFEESRCDLRENLLRYGCGEASIVYRRGEMRTEQVRAGNTAFAWLWSHLLSVLHVLRASLESSPGKIQSPQLCLCRVYSKPMLCLC